MASKSAQQEPEKAEVIEESLDALDQAFDRVKVLYEQYFLGIQKQPPQFLHGEVERKLRDLAELQIRNTALRYRFVTLQQKYGTYHTYWRRTLREIEAGRYHRSLSRVTRHAAATGAEIPHEILATMSKRMREQVRRDREAQLALQRRREDARAEALEDVEILDVEPDDDEDDAGFVSEPPEVRRRALRASSGVHVLDESDADLDLQALARQAEAELAAGGVAPAQAQAPRPRSATGPVRDVRFPGFIALRSPGAQSPAQTQTSSPAPGQARDSTQTPTQISSPSPAQAPAPASTPSPMSSPSPAPASTPSPMSSPSQTPSPSTAQAPASTQTQSPSTAQASAGPPLPKLPPLAPSQQTRPNPIAPGSSSAHPAVRVEAMTGPFPRAAPEPTGAPPASAPAATPPPSSASPSKPLAVPSPSRPPPIPSPSRPPPPSPIAQGRPPITSSPPEPRQAPPPGMSEADVNALYAKYVKAREMVGQPAGPGSFGKLMKTIHAQAPKIMQQYRARGVDFSIVIQGDQVIIRAKPKM